MGPFSRLLGPLPCPSSPGCRWDGHLACAERRSEKGERRAGMAHCSLSLAIPRSIRRRSLRSRSLRVRSAVIARISARRCAASGRAEAARRTRLWRQWRHGVSREIGDRDKQIQLGPITGRAAPGFNPGGQAGLTSFRLPLRQASGRCRQALEQHKAVHPLRQIPQDRPTFLWWWS